MPPIAPNPSPSLGTNQWTKEAIIALTSIFIAIFLAALGILFTSTRFRKYTVRCFRRLHFRQSSGVNQGQRTSGLVHLKPAKCDVLMHMC